MDAGLDHQVENATNLCARLEKPPDPVDLDFVGALEYTAVRLLVRERVHKIHIEDLVCRRAARKTHCVFGESADGVEECGVRAAKSFHARQIELAQNACFLEHRVIRSVKPVNAVWATGVADVGLDVHGKDKTPTGRCAVLLQLYAYLLPVLEPFDVLIGTETVV